MALCVDSYAKVWKITNQNDGITLQVSTSSKNRRSGEFEKDFSGFLRCYSDAKVKAAELRDGDVIKIVSFNVTTNSVKKGNNWVNYTNFNLFDFEKYDRNAPENKRKKVEPDVTEDDGFMSIPDGADEELPFN